MFELAISTKGNLLPSISEEVVDFKYRTGSVDKEKSGRLLVSEEGVVDLR